jgi:hypothetical protein
MKILLLHFRLALDLFSLIGRHYSFETKSRHHEEGTTPLSIRPRLALTDRTPYHFFETKSGHP